MNYASLITGLIIICLIVIILSLGVGLFALLAGKRDQTIYKSLAFRITLSMLLFLAIIIAIYFRWITPGAPPLL